MEPILFTQISTLDCRLDVTKIFGIYVELNINTLP